MKKNNPGPHDSKGERVYFIVDPLYILPPNEIDEVIDSLDDDISSGNIIYIMNYRVLIWKGPGTGIYWMKDTKKNIPFVFPCDSGYLMLLPAELAMQYDKSDMESSACFSEPLDTENLTQYVKEGWFESEQIKKNFLEKG